MFVYLGNRNTCICLQGSSRCSLSYCLESENVRNNLKSVRSNPINSDPSHCSMLHNNFKRARKVCRHQ